jgi:hypothetical protein
MHINIFRNDPMKVINDPISGKQIKVHEHIAGEVRLEKCFRFFM